MKIIPGSRRRHYLARVGVFLIAVALIAGMAGCDGSQSLEIRTWYDLDAVRDNLAGNHTLMNDLDSTTPGYTELASETANQGQGWQPIGTSGPFTGSFDGRGYEIRDLFINRPDEHNIGLFGHVGEGGVIKDVGAVNVTVNGFWSVGGLVGENDGTVSDSYSTGNVTGGNVGGLVGHNRYSYGTVSNSYSTGNVTGGDYAGGLVGENWGTVSDSYSTGSVAGGNVGGLVGRNNYGTVTDSCSTGSVTGNASAGGLVGLNDHGNVSNSYSIGSVTGSSWVGGLVGRNDHDNVSNSYSIGSVTGSSWVGGLVGRNVQGTVTDSYSTGSVTGDDDVGGLVGLNEYGTVSNSYSTGNVTGNTDVGGLVGENSGTVSTVRNSFWDTQTSGQATSDGGTGKNTTEMQDIDTFSSATWDITAVTNPSTRNPSYIWNIATTPPTYPFLSWEP